MPQRVGPKGPHTPDSDSRRTPQELDDPVGWRVSPEEAGVVATGLAQAANQIAAVGIQYLHPPGGLRSEKARLSWRFA